MDIVLYPDPRLRRKNSPVERFDSELATLAREMLEAMYATEGVGLAAPQVGVNLQLLVYNPEGTAEKPEAEIVLCNPKVVWKARGSESGEEGCLSFPGIYAPVERPPAARVEAQDLGGKPFALELEGWEARIFLHEFDHLDGILFIDRMSKSDRVRLKGLLDDLEQSYTSSRASA